MKIKKYKHIVVKNSCLLNITYANIRGEPLIINKDQKYKTNRRNTSMYNTLTSIAKRGSILSAAAVVVLAATVLPAAPAFADALNPLTERSLLLSSSAPGYQDTDGSGNSEGAPNASGGNFAPPGSGPNGKKSGQTFSFRVSSSSAGAADNIEAMTFQYCTKAAGLCAAPGNNSGDDHNDDRMDNAAAHVLSTPTSDLEVVYGNPVAGTDFLVYIDADNDGVFDAGESVSTGWTMETSNVEDHTDPTTGKNNFITLRHATGIEPEQNQRIGVVFKASSSQYITNPGEGTFFVKINTYKDGAADQQLPDTEANIIDGGVTVANMMTESIHITTKVLETMDFSVGVRNKDTQPVAHGSCDPIEVVNNNRLNLGDPLAENSLETDQAYDTHSYWRLSSNSSGGASVYYSGGTLANTVGDDIDEMGSEKNSHPGTEQFGLALVDAGVDTLDSDPGRLFPANHITPTIDPLVINAAYDEGDEPSISSATTADNAKFAFYKDSLTTPEVIAENSDDVLPCATAKVRYVANIAADTPAGIYTTKINYLAAPQY